MAYGSTSAASSAGAAAYPLPSTDPTAPPIYITENVVNDGFKLTQGQKVALFLLGLGAVVVGAVAAFRRH